MSDNVVLPLVTVIVPFYNAEKYLSQTIESICAQTYEKFECILVDDSSTDSSRSIAEYYAARDARIKHLMLKDNGGPAKARNYGINESKGEYIAFLDADDLWSPKKLEKQVRLLNHCLSVGLVGTNGFKIDAQGNRIARMFASDRIRRGTISLADFILKGLPLVTSSTMVRRECFERCGFFNEAYAIGEDYELWMRIIQKFDVDILDEDLISYRVHDSNSTKSKIKNRYFKVQIFENEILTKIDLLGTSAEEILLKLQKMYTTLGKLYRAEGNIEMANYYLQKSIALNSSILVTIKAILYKFGGFHGPRVRR